MSAATRAKTAKERANIAARFIRAGKTSGRAFADCFEMGDATVVVVYLLEKSQTDEKIAEYAKKAGWKTST